MNGYEKIAKNNIKGWRNSDCTELYDAYGKCSKKKRNAWQHCKDLQKEYNGRDLKIISHNSYKFTAGFEFVDPDTGEIMFMYIGPGYNQAVSIS